MAEKIDAPAEERLRVLVIDDEKAFAQTVAEVLEDEGYEVTLAYNGREGVKKLSETEFDLILTDLNMPDVDGLGVLRALNKEEVDSVVMVISGQKEVKKAVQALSEGASRYMLKESDDILGEIRAAVRKSAEEFRHRRRLRELTKQLEERFGFEGVIGNSPKMQELITRLKAFAPTPASVLILGENGTGKELVAKALHNNSPRKNKPFVAMNCAALNENLLDDEMFGHEAGAFTGAEKMRKGRFEYANGGTLFLDEVGDMPLTLQAKLLRVLENREVSRIGSNETIKVDVRLIAATNRDLEAMIREGKFRQDLYFRLRVGILRIPPLRERKNDIPLLVTHFIKEFAQRYGKKPPRVSNALWRAFENYSWPGNVRELRNQIESMVIQDSDEILDLDDLLEGDPLRGVSELPATTGTDHLIGRPLREVERYYTQKALELAKGNRSEAAKILGIGERTLYRQIKSWEEEDLGTASSALDSEAEEKEEKVEKEENAPKKNKHKKPSPHSE
jgi:two-component system response regulator HydG